MTRNFILIVILLGFNNLQAQIHQYEWNWVIELNGKSLLNGNISNFNYKSRTFGYSDTNTITETAIYNDKAKLTNSIRYVSEGLGDFHHSTLRVYSSDDITCTLQYQIQNGDTASVIKFDNDTLGRKLKATRYNWGEYWNNYNFLYNSGGLVKEIYALYGKNNDTSRTIYNYNSKGIILGITKYNNAIFHKSIEWKYNKNGDLVESTYIHGGHPEGSYKEIYINDSLGHIKDSKKTDLNDNFVMHKTFDYNDMGNIESETLMKQSGDTLVHFFREYEYDKYDNWVSCITTANDTLYQIEEREIDYIENNRQKK
ncbi:MAG: hypothetical protein AB8B74_10925 [Crocinitomicaceae bacterium]